MGIFFGLVATPPARQDHLPTAWKQKPRRYTLPGWINLSEQRWVNLPERQRDKRYSSYKPVVTENIGDMGSHVHWNTGPFPSERVPVGVAVWNTDPQRIRVNYRAGVFCPAKPVEVLGRSVSSESGQLGA